MPTIRHYSAEAAVRARRHGHSRRTQNAKNPQTDRKYCNPLIHQSQNGIMNPHYRQQFTSSLPNRLVRSNHPRWPSREKPPMQWTSMFNKGEMKQSFLWPDALPVANQQE